MDRNPDLFLVIHWGVWLEVLHINFNLFDIGREHHNVTVSYVGGKIIGWCDNTSRLFKQVASVHDYHVLSIYFCGLLFYKYVIYTALPHKPIFLVYKEYGVCSLVNTIDFIDNPKLIWKLLSTVF